MNDMQKPVTDPFAPLTPTEGGAPATDHWEPMLPAPKALPSKIRHPAHGDAVATWAYLNAAGAVLHAVARFDDQNGGKVTCPFTYGRRVWVDGKGKAQDRTQWHMKGPLAPRPLYGLDRLAARPDAPVLLVEGEKSADAAAAMFPDHVVITSGGSTSARGADWSPVAGRDVIIWPDHDEPGIKYAETAASRMIEDAGPKSVRTVEIPASFPQKWDVADALPEGLAVADLRQMLNDAQPAAGTPMEMPPRFSMREGALYYQQDAKRSGELPAPVFVAGAFEVVARTRDSGRDGWGILLRWKDADGWSHEWAMPCSMLHGEVGDIAARLADGGLACSHRAHNYLRIFLEQARPTRRLESVTRTGWHQSGDKTIMVAPWGQTYGRSKAAVILQSDRKPDATLFEARGSLTEWQHEVARLAVGNDRLVLSICTGLAGPLLHLAAQDSGGFHLRGASKTGKTTCALVAGSVWGPGVPGGQVRPWRATANGLEAIASETNDGTLILDEMGQADAREVADIVYGLANGSGKVRANRNAGSRRQHVWRTLFLSTGELSLAAKMAEGGKKPMAGLDVRLVSIPADAGAGMGVFQNLHEFASSSDLADHLRRAARTFCGTPARAYVERLADDRSRNEPGIVDFIDATARDFAEAHIPASADGQVRSVAARFALVAAAGEIARRYGLVPWPKGEAFRAAGECFQAWLTDRGDAGSGEEIRAVRQVKKFIEAHGASRFEQLVFGDESDAAGDAKPGGLKVRDRVGFVRGSFSEGAVEYLVLTEAWRDTVCAGLDAAAAAKTLADRGFLLRGRDGRITQKPRLPGHPMPVRCYVISSAILGGEDE